MNKAKIDDRNNRISTLGERSVMQILIDHHGWCDFNVYGWKHYKIHSTRNQIGAELQKKEIDLIEEWTDKDGVEHRKAHEVKTEEASLSAYYEYPKKYVDDVYWWALQREHNDNDGKPVSRWELTGTGNTFIETAQLVGGKKDKGWAYVLRDTQTEVNEKFSEGRSVWVVQYSPKSVPQLPDWAEPYNYFSAFEIPDGYIIDGLKNEKRTWREYSNDAEGKWGYLVRLSELYDVRLFNEDRVIGRTDEKTGVTFYRDRSVWRREEKDINESWTADDFKIEPFERSV